MTLVLALVLLACLPVLISLFRQKEKHRLYGFAAIGALLLAPGLPIVGYLYGWPMWNGTSLGISISLITVLALALLVTRRKTRGKLSFWPLFVFYGLVLVLSIIPSAMKIGTVFSWWQFGTALVVFAAIAYECHRSEPRNYLAYGLSIGLIYQAGQVIWQKASGAVQAAGTFGHQNILGLAIELSVVPLIALILGGNKSSLLKVGVAAALICVGGSGSRATVAIAGAAILLLLVLSVVLRSTPRKINIIGFAFVGLLLATPLAISTMNQRFGDTQITTEDAGRDSMERTATLMANDHPFGVGANQYVPTSIHGGYADRAGMSWMWSIRNKPVHNAYLLARAETGYLGQAAFLLVLVVPIIAAFRLAVRNRRNEIGELALGSAVALTANALHNNYEFAVHTASIFPLVLLNIGVIAALLRQEAMARSAARREARARTEELEPAPA